MHECTANKTLDAANNGDVIGLSAPQARLLDAADHDDFIRLSAPQATFVSKEVRLHVDEIELPEQMVDKLNGFSDGYAEAHAMNEYGAPALVHERKDNAGSLEEETDDE